MKTKRIGTGAYSASAAGKVNGTPVVFTFTFFKGTCGMWLFETEWTDTGALSGKSSMRAQDPYWTKRDAVASAAEMAVEGLKRHVKYGWVTA